MIGLSGLITPSLDEMVHVAKEMEREGFHDAAADRRRDDQRQAHGGQDRAVLSRAPCIHVKDASRCVGVVDRLMRPEQRATLDRENRAAQEKDRESFTQAPRTQAGAVRRGACSAASPSTGRTPTSPSRRSSARACCDDFPLDELVPYIDWSPFFMAWELKGKYPQIFNDPHVGKEARDLFDEAQTLLRADHRREAADGQRASTASSPPTATATTSSSTPTRRARTERAASRCCGSNGSAKGRRASAAWPTTSRRSESGMHDYLGAFAVTAGFGADGAGRRTSRRTHDDYNAIMVEALADRLAEAFAELLHERARRDWGYGQSENAVARRT